MFWTGWTRAGLCSTHTYTHSYHSDHRAHQFKQHTVKRGPLFLASSLIAVYSQIRRFDGGGLMVGTLAVSCTLNAGTPIMMYLRRAIATQQGSIHRKAEAFNDTCCSCPGETVFTDEPTPTCCFFFIPLLLSGELKPISQLNIHMPDFLCYAQQVNSNLEMFGGLINCWCFPVLCCRLPALCTLCQCFGVVATEQASVCKRLHHTSATLHYTAESRLREDEKWGLPTPKHPSMVPLPPLHLSMQGWMN